MPALATLALLVAALPAGAERAPQAVADALRRAVPVEGGRVEISDYRPTLPRGCEVARAEVSGPLATSGRVALRLGGRMPGGTGCDGWAWARVRLLAPVLVASRALRAGEPLSGAVSPEERELSPGRVAASRLSPDAVAARPLAAGQALDEADLRVGPAPGESVVLVVHMGSLRVEQAGRAVPCSRGHACALTANGKRVEGSWQDGRILVSSP